MSTHTIGWDVLLSGDHADTIERVTELLREQGFGVLTRIDMHQKFLSALGIETPRHTILGACNPQLAYDVLSRHPEAALLLPCNVSVQEKDDGGVMVSIANPESMFGFADADEATAAVVREASRRLHHVVESLEE